MAIEIERKFLVEPTLWSPPNPGSVYRQGYLSRDPNRTVRVRQTANKAFLTIKGRQYLDGCAEYEYLIPVSDAEEMLDGLCLPGMIEKVRYRVLIGRHVWDVDEFSGENTGLLLAEIELDHRDETFEWPPWISREVTGDPRYYNAMLSQNPYKNWFAG